MNKIETYELTSLRKYLAKLQTKDMTGSGIRLCIVDLGGLGVGDMDFMGEYLPELIPVLLKSLDETLSLRAATARSDLAKIHAALEGKE